MILKVIFSKRLTFSPQVLHFVNRLSHRAVNPQEVQDLYPPIFDCSEEGLKRHNRQIWYDTIKSLPSVEQKLHELAVQQLLDLNTYTLTTVPCTYNASNFYSYITRTHVVKDLPKQVQGINVDTELSEIRETLCNVLHSAYYNVWGNRYGNFGSCALEKYEAVKLLKSLILQCYKKLGVRNNYILNSTIQQNPRICSFWWHGGYGKEDDDVYTKNLCFQYEDHASLSIRVNSPLLPILDPKDPLCTDAEIPDYHYHPDVFHIPTSTNKLAAIPGFWPNDTCEFPFLIADTFDGITNLTSKLENYDADKVYDNAGIMMSFAWLNAVAMYQGFTPFNDITYPFTTQAILTNGQDWRFYVYQLNTTAFHEDVDKKDLKNFCWTSGNMRLFDSIRDSKIVGINEEVFRVLLQFLHNAPLGREGVQLKPYLGEDTRTEEEKQHLRYFLRKMYSRVPEKMAHRDEVPTWVKIYKEHKDAPPSPFVRLA